MVWRSNKIIHRKYLAVTAVEWFMHLLEHSLNVWCAMIPEWVRETYVPETYSVVMWEEMVSLRRTIYSYVRFNEVLGWGHSWRRLAKVWLIGSSTRARSEGREGAGRECCSSRGDAPGLKEKRAPSVGLDGPQGCQGDKWVSFHYVCGSGQSILS